ncbi:hypothetical protein MalM25_35020 [Planctomycetes bacterium MalM25]|nr:hypothetical protein MalM25_35020 [Planctomycetes bacterium MalM25]
MSQRPNLGNRPHSSIPGVNRPSTKPGANRPNINRPGTNRPGTRPGGSIANRPGTGNRPGAGNRPNRPGGSRPNLPNRPGAKPTPGGVGDFLGLDKPLKPDSGLAGKLPNRPSTLPGNRPGIGNRPGNGDRPGLGNRPNRPGNRPGLGNRPGNRPNRPNIGDRNRPNFGDRNRWTNNGVINNRANWVNIDNIRNVNLHRNWNNAFGRPGWRAPGVARRSYWRGWSNGVRHNWGHYHRYGGWYGGSWWNRHPHGLCGWHYHYWNHNRGWGYWWRVPVWSSFANWFTWQQPATVWSEPVYYDYGSEGNVVYQDNSVYIGGEEVGTTEDFAMSAMDLATVEPPASEEEAAEAEWMPLGTFAISTDEQDTDPSMTVQLAVNREGIVAGTLYNIETDEAQSVQGSVDRETQRVAVRFGENEDLVAETGLYNLTQDEAPVLVHFGADRTENYLLVRLDEPEEGEGEEDAAGE